MSPRTPFSVRLYSLFLKLLVPGLGEEYSTEAATVFRDLGADARSRGVRDYLGFLAREIGSLLSTAAKDRKRNGEGRGDSGIGLGPLRQDLRYALRSFRRSPGFVAVTLLSLTFAIAVSTVIFSVVNAGFFRPVPYVEAQDRMVRVFTDNGRFGRGPSSYPDYLDYREMSRSLGDVAAMRSEEFTVGAPTEGTRRTWGLEVSENYFDVLGIPLTRGRGFLPEDVASGGRVAVIGHNTWQREFGGDPGVLGQALFLNGHPHTVIGVGPKGMVGVDDPLLVEIVRPLMSFRDFRGRKWLSVVGRMNDDASLPQVQAEFETIGRDLADAYPEAWADNAGSPTRLDVLSLQDARIPEGAPLLAIFGGVGALSGLIMLIACSNVANLLLTRAFRRRTEIAIRSAIGAPSRRVFGQLLTENLLLFGVAGILGLLVTHWLAWVVQSGWVLIPPPGVEFSVDGRVALFTLALTVLTGLTFGLIPARQASRTDLVPALKGLAPSHRFRFLGLRNLLVGAQIGGAMVLVLVTLLLVKSLSFAKTIELGHDPTGIATLTVDVSHRDYSQEEGLQFFYDLLTRTSALQGVDAVGLATWVPLAGGSTLWGGLEPEGYEPGPQEFVEATGVGVTPGYIALTRMTLLAGRDFEPEDREGSPRVVLVNQSFVDTYWPGQEAIGKQIGRGEESEALRVIGVVADVPYDALSQEVGPHIWFPLAQSYSPELVLHARTRGDPRLLLPLLRQQVADLDSNLPVIGAELMETISANATMGQRILSAALGGAGFFALALAMLGIYGVVGYSVSQRTREMGLRMALGAEPGRVVRLVLKEGAVLSLIGLVPGLLGAFGASQLLRAALLGMNPMDPVAFGGGALILIASVLCASLAPGIRASKADPMTSLRAE